MLPLRVVFAPCGSNTKMVSNIAEVTRAGVEFDHFLAVPVGLKGVNDFGSRPDKSLRLCLEHLKHFLDLSVQRLIVVKVTELSCPQIPGTLVTDSGATGPAAASYGKGNGPASQDACIQWVSPVLIRMLRSVAHTTNPKMAMIMCYGRSLT